MRRRLELALDWMADRPALGLALAFIVVVLVLAALVTLIVG